MDARASARPFLAVSDVVSIASASLPLLSQHAAREDMPAVRQTLNLVLKSEEDLRKAGAKMSALLAATVPRIGRSMK